MSVCYSCNGSERSCGKMNLRGYSRTRSDAGTRISGFPSRSVATFAVSLQPSLKIVRSVAREFFCLNLNDCSIEEYLKLTHTYQRRETFVLKRITMKRVYIYENIDLQFNCVWTLVNISQSLFICFLKIEQNA